jgi:hypothetical protein
MGGHTEDITRLDFAYAVNMHDVDQNIIYRRSTPPDTMKYTDVVCHDLIMWAWTRKPHEIIIGEETELCLVAFAKEMVERYHPSLALVPPAEQVIKLARISVAIAMMCFSSDDDGNCCIVRPSHAMAAFNFLERIYSSDAMGFAQISRKLFKRENLRNTVELEQRFTVDSHKCDMLLAYDIFNHSDIELIMGVDQMKAKEYINLLLTCNAIEPLRTSRKQEFRKTVSFIKWIQNNIRSKDSKIDMRSVFE